MKPIELFSFLLPLAYPYTPPVCSGTTDPLTLLLRGCFIGAIFFTYYNLLYGLFPSLVIGGVYASVYLKSENFGLSMAVLVIMVMIYGYLLPQSILALIILSIALLFATAAYEAFTSG